MEELALADKLPFWHFDGDILVFDDGSLGCGFVLQGKDISSSEASSINEFNQSLKTLLLSIKEEYRVQVFYRLTPYVGKMIKNHDKLMGHESKRYEIVRNARMAFLRENEKKGHYFVPEMTFLLRGHPYSYKRQNPFKSSEKFLQLTLDEYKGHKEEFLKERKKVEKSLELCALRPRYLTKHCWFDLLFSYFNLSRSERVGCPTLREDDVLFNESLVDQIALSDVGIEKSFLRVGNYFFKFITLATLPESMTYASMVDGFLKLPFHFWVSQSIVIHNQAREIDKLKTQRRLAYSFSQGAEKVSDIESESKLSQIEELLEELVEGSDRIVSSSFSVIVWDEKRNEVESKADEVIAAFREMNQAEGIKEDYAGWEVFLKNCPDGF